MESTQMTKVVLFDLDNTLFDHSHSLRSAISIIQEKYPSLAGNTLGDLVTRYNAVLQRAYDKYLYKKITYEEADLMKVQLFFTELDLLEPSPKEVREFRAIYKHLYRENRRATPGSVETLVRLHDKGYRIAVVLNGQIEDQTAKAEAIKIRHLVDRIFTSEEAGCCKPDHRIFQFAIEALGTHPHMVPMVGDSIDSDIKGALDAGLSAILYSPMAQESRLFLFGKEVPVIHRMDQVLEHMGIINHRFEPCFISLPGQLVIEGIDIDIVTEARHCMRISKETVISLVENMGRVLVGVSKKLYGSAMSCLEEMIRMIARVAMLIDETAIQISYPCQGQGGVSAADPECHFTVRDHSICAEYAGLALSADSENEAVLRNVAILLQSHCNNLMKDNPSAAVLDLRSVILVLAEKARVNSDTIIKGVKIDE